ncbi:hypothetical protein OAF74_02685, partial [bacterium]|nr:hypothetical protein [bacterium]
MPQIDDLLLSFGISPEENGQSTPPPPQETPTATVQAEVKTVEEKSEPQASPSLREKVDIVQEEQLKPAAKEPLSHAEKIEAARTNSRINPDLIGTATSNSTASKRNTKDGVFFPSSPNTLEEAGASLSEVSNLILKFLYSSGVETGYRVSIQLGLKFPLIEAILRQLKLERLVGYKNSIAGGDYLYELTDLGRERSRTLTQQSTYFGTAPVPLKMYIESVHQQSIADRKP